MRAKRLDHIAGFGIDKVAEAAEGDRDILRLENLDIDLPVPPGVDAATREAVGKDEYNGFIPFSGRTDLKEAVADHVDRVFTSFFYGHLEEPERRRFVVEARRVARELVLVEPTLGDGLAPEGWEERPLADGSRHLVYKRYFQPERLAEELGGGEVIFGGALFLIVVSSAQVA